jgi:hypothetical protein
MHLASCTVLEVSAPPYEDLVDLLVSKLPLLPIEQACDDQGVERVPFNPTAGSRHPIVSVLNAAGEPGRHSSEDAGDKACRRDGSFGAQLDRHGREAFEEVDVLGEVPVTEELVMDARPPGCPESVGEFAVVQ